MPAAATAATVQAGTATLRAANEAEVRRLLETLEAACDLDWEREKLARWRRFLALERCPGGFRSAASPLGGRPAAAWPKIRLNDALRDERLMLLHQLGDEAGVLHARNQRVPNIRCNYGTGILSSLFGAELFWMPEELDTLPTTRALAGADPIGALLSAGEPDLDSGWGKRVFATAEFFKAALAPYPKLAEVVWIYHPDLQGPVDIAELLLGEHLLLGFYDRPEEVRAVLELITRTYIRFMKRWFALVPPRSARDSAHWGRLIPGQIMLRGDSLVNLSPEVYDEFVRPCDERILAEFGGGGMHYCGKADHCLERMTSGPLMRHVNSSQPDLNDPEKLLEFTVGRGRILDVPARHEALFAGRLDRGVLLS
ncbi:MAG TPA: hypothetical protein PK280_17290 [Planctomycetota bacterium]|nr:hypothetical protein [Planctomycetota bacterium]